VRGLDEELLVELEAAIHEQGLRGVLVGRLVDGEGKPVLDETQEVRAMQALATGTYRVQIAWGHHRLEAARRAGVLDVRVEIVPGLDDEKMAAWALMENVRRKELSAIEEAQAIRQLVDGFHWTHERVAESLGYGSAATVSNKLRLLRLPEEIQEQVKTGDLAERSARMLVRVAEVAPRAAVALVQDRAANPDSRPLQEYEIERELVKATKPLAGNEWDRAPWPEGWLPAALGEDAVACEACDQHVQVRGQPRCKKVTCWHTRRRAWEAQCTESAAQACGVPALGEDEKGRSFFANWMSYNFASLRCRPEGGETCPHLRVRYADIYEVNGVKGELVCGDGEASRRAWPRPRRRGRGRRSGGRRRAKSAGR